MEKMERMSEEKSLKIIQKIAEIGKILSKIVYVFCIVGVIGCLIGIAAISLVGVLTFEIDGRMIGAIIENESNMSIGSLYASMAAGLILCFGEIFLSGRAVRYFKNELAAGTPFTHEGAKEMRNLGISAIWIPIAALIVADITYAIINACFDSVADMHLDKFNSVGIGVAFIVISILCSYGASLREKTQPEPDMEA